MRIRTLRRYAKLLILCVAPLVSSTAYAAGPTADSAPRPRIDYGLSTAKRANCMGCHKWHGDGGPGYGGAAISLRKTQLDRAQLIELIRCGRPGTNMPYFDRKAYKEKLCYEMILEDFAGDEDNRPLQGKKYLNDRQIDAVADFIIGELQGKEITRVYCEKYFGGPTRQCESFTDPLDSN